ncbi:MAG: polymerase sigma factor SigD [Planctomycetota bacterium]|jgi:RNA polymerase sigma-70 factor (ECF subfamily)
MSSTDPKAEELERFGQMLEANMDGLRAFLRARASAGLRAKLDQSDLVQSVCREALDGAPEFEFRDEPSFRSWLYTLALRKLVEKNRRFQADKRAAVSEVPLDAEGGEEMAEAHGARDSRTPSRLAMEHEEVEKLRDALAALDESEREIIVLARFAELSHAEIAAYLGKSEASCRKALSRALLVLADELHKRGLRG